MSKAKGKYCCECEFWEMIGQALPSEFIHEGRCTVPCDDRDESPIKEAFDVPCDRWVRRKLERVTRPRIDCFRDYCYMCKHWIHVRQGWDEGLCEVEKCGLVGAYEQACCEFEKKNKSDKK